MWPSSVIRTFALSVKLPVAEAFYIARCYVMVDTSQRVYIQGVSGGIVNILAGGSMVYSE